MYDTNAHTKTLDELVRSLHTDLDGGLTRAEAQARFAELGANELSERLRPGFFALLLNQLNNYLVIVLIVAAVISLVLGEYIDSIAIMVIVVLNAVVGVIQEGKAEEALAALKKMAAPNAQVVRDGQRMTVPGREIVPGDLVLLEAGNFVPADLRLIESINLRIEEASLTGESQPVEKDSLIVLDSSNGAIPIGDRRNAAFMGTVITYGRGRGVVCGTGMNTQIGLIAEMIQSSEEEHTPLQKALEELGKLLGTACLAICALVFLYGIIRDTHVAIVFDAGILAYLTIEKAAIIHLFMTAVSLAIAAVPEGLAAIVTICLALGMQRMIKHHALIRKLPAVETLGCATVICSDKTGTLTQNEMTVVQGWAGGKRLRISGEGYAPDGEFFLGADTFDPRIDADVSALLCGALLCNDAVLEERKGEGGNAWRIIGDPTEGALVVAAAKSGYRRADLETALPRIQEVPFDSDRKRMSTIHRVSKASEGTLSQLDTGAFASSPLVAFVKGAPDAVLDLSTQVLESGRIVDMSAERRAGILEQNRDMASQALRVLAVAYRPLQALPDRVSPEAIEKELVFIGMLGMIDPPRPEAIEALKVARGAGLRAIMITGDYRETAEAIARQVGLLTPGGRVLSGPEIEALDNTDLQEETDRLEVCCRVSPQHKTRIVEALKARGHIVAMTGDGVNDAPALKHANIGVAMGITGTDVAKQTADMVLTDDNFASIVAAVEQGRIVYSNIRKFVYFLLACNIGEILIIFGSMVLGLPIPLLPVQLLWLNLVSDGAPALALGLETGDQDTMTHPPRSPHEHVINRDMATGIAVVGLVDTVAIIGVFYLALQRYPDQLIAAQTIAFVSLCCSELIRAFAARSECRSMFSIGVFSNRWMVWAVGVSLLLVLMAVYLPLLHPVFDTVPLGVGDWVLMAPFFLASPLAMELVKCHFRRRKARRLAA